MPDQATEPQLQTFPIEQFLYASEGARRKGQQLSTSNSFQISKWSFPGQAGNTFSNDGRYSSAPYYACCPANTISAAAFAGDLPGTGKTSDSKFCFLSYTLPVKSFVFNPQGLTPVAHGED